MVQTLPAVQTTLDGPSRKQHIVSHLLGHYTQPAELRRSLVRMHLSIGGCGFLTKFELEDLGVTVEDDAVRQALSKLMVLGEKRLLPESYMKKLGQIRGGARYAFKERAFRTEIGSFVPYSNYAKVIQEMERFEHQYFAFRDEIIRDYQQLKRQTLSEYDVIARDAYRRIQSTRPDLLQEPLEQFVATYCNRIAAQIPTTERIRKTFTFKLIKFDEFAQYTTAQAQALSPEIEREVPSLEALEALRGQAQDQEWQKGVIERDLRLQAQARLSDLDALCTSLVSQMRSQVYDAVRDVLATLQRRSGESFAPQSVTQLKNLMERVKGLNFYGDQDIDRIMARMQEIVDMSPEARKQSLGDIQAKLRAVATVTRATLLDLDGEPRSAREFAIPDIPTDLAVREARTSLGLDLDPALFANLSAVRTERSSTGRTLAQGGLWEGIDLGSLSRSNR